MGLEMLSIPGALLRPIYALLRFGVARKASRDIEIALPRAGVRRATLLALAGVLGGTEGVGLIFFAERIPSSAGPLFSLSDVSSRVSSLRFFPSKREAASLLRTIRMEPAEAGPSLH